MLITLLKSAYASSTPKYLEAASTALKLVGPLIQPIVEVAAMLSEYDPLSLANISATCFNIKILDTCTNLQDSTCQKCARCYAHFTDPQAGAVRYSNYDNRFELHIPSYEEYRGYFQHKRSANIEFQKEKSEAKRFKANNFGDEFQ